MSRVPQIDCMWNSSQLRDAFLSDSLVTIHKLTDIFKNDIGLIFTKRLVDISLLDGNLELMVVTVDSMVCDEFELFKNLLEVVDEIYSGVTTSWVDHLQDSSIYIHDDLVYTIDCNIIKFFIIL